MIGNHLFGHTVAGNPAVTHLTRDGCAGVGDFGTASIIQAEHHIDGLVVLGALLRHLKFVDDGLPQFRAATGPAHAYTPLVHLRHTTVDDVAREAHEEAHLLRRALPVLSGERVQRQVAYARFDGTGNGVEYHRFGGLMAVGADQSALLRPTTVAVHDYAHMARYLVLREIGNNRRIGKRSRRNVKRLVVHVLKSHTR